MADGSHDADLRKQARLTGLLFIFVNALYIASLVMSSREILPADLAATARNLATAEPAFRIGAGLQALASALTIPLAGAFYVLVARVSPGLALVAFGCRVAEAALFGLFAIASFIALDTATGGAAATNDTWRLLLNAQRTSGSIAQIYFCLGSALFFYLLLKSRFVPRPVSGFVILATLFSLVSTLTGLMAPQLAGPLQMSGPVLLASEAVAGFWLLIAGAKRPMT